MTKKSRRKDARRKALIDALEHPTPRMKATLRQRKQEGGRKLRRPDFVWHLLLQSFATWGSSRGWHSLIGTKSNYERVTFEALSDLPPRSRLPRIKKVFRDSGLRYTDRKAILMSRNFDIVAEMGGPRAAKRTAMAQEGREAKIAFMKRFAGIGEKYARNIWMDSYHPDFRDAIAIDERIKKVTEALGYSFNPGQYEEHERFYQDIAVEAGLESWEVDRLLYNHLDEFLETIESAWFRQAPIESSGSALFLAVSEQDPQQCRCLGKFLC